MNRWLYLPDSAVGDLEVLSGLDESKITALVNLIASDDDRDRYKLSLQIAETLQIGDQKAAEFYNFWQYVDRERRSEKKSPFEVVGEIVAFLKSRLEDKGGALADAITAKSQVIQSLFGDFPARDLLKSVRRLEMGPLPHVHTVESVCDLRPVFERGNEHINLIIPIITMRIGYHDACNDHHELIVQLTELGLEAFEKDLKRIRRRLQAVRARIEEDSASEAVDDKS